MNDLIDNLLGELKSISSSHPYVVVNLMHEIMRLTYPEDPYVYSNSGIDNSGEHQSDRLEFAINNAIKTISCYKNIGSYNINFEEKKYSLDIKDDVGSVYGLAWKDNDAEFMVNEAKDIIIERFNNNNIDLSNIVGKKVLDLGCGSGRYTCALALLGAGHVTGVDYGDEGLQKGRSLSDKFGLSIDFQKQNILDLSFDTDSFDFVFCNGVTHHTEDIIKATSEIYRVLKPSGSAWYYIYGSGGYAWRIIKEFNSLMKNVNIPKEYAHNLLEMIGMPENRHIFIDHLYVPILTLTSKKEFETMLNTTGFSDFRRCFNGRSTDADYLVETGSDRDRELWGDAELRYFVIK